MINSGNYTRLDASIGFMVFTATFHNSSVASWGSVFLVEVPGENHCPAISHWNTFSHNVV